MEAGSSNSCFRSDRHGGGRRMPVGPNRRKKYPFRNWSRMLSAIYRLAKSGSVSLSRSIDLNHFHDVLIATSFNTPPLVLHLHQPTTAKPDDQSDDPHISPLCRGRARLSTRRSRDNLECISLPINSDRPRIRTFVTNEFSFRYRMEQQRKESIMLFFSTLVYSLNTYSLQLL